MRARTFLALLLILIVLFGCVQKQEEEQLGKEPLEENKNQIETEKTEQAQVIQEVIQDDGLDAALEDLSALSS